MEVSSDGGSVTAESGRSPRSGAWPPPPAADAASPVDPAPFHLRVVTFDVTADGPVLRTSSVHRGRVKGAPHSDAPDRFEIVGWNTQGAEVFRGSVPHPNHEWLEFPASDLSGQLERTVRTVEAASLFLRLPEESGVVALRLTERRYDPTSAAVRHRSFDFALRP